MSNTRTDPFRAPVKSWAYHAASGSGGCDVRVGKEASTDTVPMHCEDVGFGHKHSHPSKGFEGRDVDSLLLHS